MRTRKYFPLFWIMCLLFLTGCHSGPPPQPPFERPLFEPVTAPQLPSLHDEESRNSLRQAILKSLSWYARVPRDKPLAFCDRTITAGVMQESLAHFLSLLDSGRLDTAVLAREFDVFRVVPPDRAGQMLVTGYYEPVLEGSLKPGKEYKWPLYPMPSDLVVIELERFDPSRLHGERLVGRVEKDQVVPYYTRAEIDRDKKLERSTAPLAWLKDPVDCYFLHVQGSGVIKLPEGRELRVGYAGANGRPYHSIGKTLIDSGAVAPEGMSLQAIRNYLWSHPEKRDESMWSNESYVFFRWVAEGPLGSLDTVLTAGRSIATDPKFHPRASLAFLVSEKPRYDSSGHIEGWDRIGRWVLNQDTGGAIKGPGRVDLFCGTGDGAEKVAGPMKQPGELYYFVKKGSTK